MKLKEMHKIIFAILLSMLILSSCDESWEEHYNKPEGDQPEYNLYGFIQSHPGLGKFSQMLEMTGYDTIISASQTYTIWAPTDAALSGISLDDQDLVLEIVINHIARGNFSTSGIVSRPVKMLNGKNIYFEGSAEGYFFGNKNLVESNYRTRNGQVHIIDGYVPYNNNILEFIQRTEGLDSIRQYLSMQDQWIFDSINSQEIRIDSLGNVVYDSIFIFSNIVLDRIGSLGVEDSMYTVIIPDNTGWSEAYLRTKPYFNVPDIFGGPGRGKTFARWSVVRDMVFRDIVEDPSQFSTLESTGKNVFYSPADLFVNAEMYELSNGLGYVTSQMPYPDTSSWFKTIKVEGEYPFGRQNSNSNIYIRTGLGSGLDISDNNYIIVDPTGISNIAQPSVEFPIPNSLSATYNIYCVFVPASVTDPDNMLPNKATFLLTYIRTTTGRTGRQTFIPENNITDPTGLTKMFIGQFDFEFANVQDAEFSTSAVKLEVKNAVTIEEENAGTFSRTMQIDCIIFEPVF